MVSRIWLANAILALLVVFLGLKAYGVWIQGTRGQEIPQMAQGSTREITEPSRDLNAIKVPPESGYDELATLNLFASERAEIIPEMKKQDEKPTKLSAAEQKDITQYFSKLVLYGLVITNDSAEALVSCPVKKPVLKRGTNPNRNNLRSNKQVPTVKQTRNNLRSNKQIPAVKQTKWIKAGDKLGDFTVVSIDPDRVFLKAGDQSYDLLLYDKEKVKKRGPARPKTGPTVVGADVRPSVPKVKGKKVDIPLRLKKGTELKKRTKVKKGTELEKGVEVKSQLDARPPAMRDGIDRSGKPQKTGGFARPQTR